MNRAKTFYCSEGFPQPRNASASNQEREPLSLPTVQALYCHSLFLHHTCATLAIFRMAGISNGTTLITLPLWNVGETMGIACLLALLPCLACLARAACDCWTRTHLSRKVAPVEGPRLDPPATPALRRATLSTSVRTGLADRIATAKRAAASMRTRVSGLTLQASTHTPTTTVEHRTFTGQCTQTFFFTPRTYERVKNGWTHPVESRTIEQRLLSTPHRMRLTPHAPLPHTHARSNERRLTYVLVACPLVSHLTSCTACSVCLPLPDWSVVRCRRHRSAHRIIGLPVRHQCCAGVFVHRLSRLHRARVDAHDAGAKAH